MTGFLQTTTATNLSPKVQDKPDLYAVGLGEWASSVAAILNNFQEQQDLNSAACSLDTWLSMCRHQLLEHQEIGKSLSFIQLFVKKQ